MSKLQNFKAMMAQTDPTARFVGFFLLLQLLTEQPALAEECWEHVDVAFLDKLVQSKENNNTSNTEAIDLRSLGISILYAFSDFEQVARSVKFERRSGSLLKVLNARYNSISKDQSDLDKFAAVLTKIVTTESGAVQIVSSEHFQKFASLVIDTGWQAGIEVLRCAILNVTQLKADTAELFQDKLKVIIIELVSTCGEESFKLLSSICSTVEPERLLKLLDLQQALALRIVVKDRLVHPKKGQNTSAWLPLYATLLRIYGEPFLVPTAIDEEMRLLALISGLISTEVRSSLAPSLEKLHSEQYQSIVLQTSSAFEIMRHVTSYLLTTEEPNFSVDEILRIRDNFCDALSETISYLRDRWDQSPLSPHQGWHTSRNMTDQKDTATGLLRDPIILSGTQALCLWLQDDESLQSNACGIMDVLLGFIYEGRKVNIDYRAWIEPAIEALLETEKGKVEFEHIDGERILSQVT